MFNSKSKSVPSLSPSLSLSLFRLPNLERDRVVAEAEEEKGPERGY